MTSAVDGRSEPWLLGQDTYYRELEASFDEEASGQLIGLADAIADLKTR